MVKTVKESSFEEIRVAPAGRERRIEFIRNAFPKRGYRPRVAWVHCPSCVVETKVKRIFEEIGDAVGISGKRKILMKASK